MNRVVLGAVSALLLAAAGLFWWQGRAEVEQGAPPPLPAEPVPDPDLVMKTKLSPEMIERESHGSVVVVDGYKRTPRNSER